MVDDDAVGHEMQNRSFDDASPPSCARAGHAVEACGGVIAREGNSKSML